MEADGVAPYSEASGRYAGHWRRSDGFGYKHPHRYRVHTVATLTREDIVRHALAWYAEERARADGDCA